MKRISFDRIQLEVGVTFKEDQKYKTGGKDFFRKYKRYSVENFQKQVGITQSSPKKIEKKEETKTEPIEEKEGFYGSDFENTEPSAMNNTLHLKTKNLRQAMKNLDLITEEEESAMQKQFNKTKPDNLFTYGNKTTSNEDKYDDMDKFAKTLLTSSDWGASALKFKKNLPFGKVPFKPRNTVDGFNKRVTHSRMFIKSKPLSLGVMDRGYATTTEGFFKKNKKSLSPLKTSNKETKELIKVLEKGDKDDFVRTTTDKMFKKK